MNVAPGSVRVTAAGVLLTEGTDYTVDYTAGRVKILNRQLIDAKTPIEVSLQGGDALSQAAQDPHRPRPQLPLL